MAVLSRPWPFYQGRSSQVARHPDFGRGLQGRAISLSAAGPSYFQQKQVQWPFYQREAQWPLSKQKQPDGQTSRFQRQIAILVLSRTSSLSAAGPSYSQQKQAQWPFYQREAQWPFYQSRSNRMARPPDFSDKLALSRTISLSAAGQAQWPFYQREAQWPFYQSRSNRMRGLIWNLQSAAQVWQLGCFCFDKTAKAFIKRPLGLVLIKRQFAKNGLAWLLIN